MNLRTFLLVVAVCVVGVTMSLPTRIRRGGFNWNPLGINIPTANGPVAINPNLGANWSPKKCVCS
jgi:hypothetical protein